MTFYQTNFSLVQHHKYSLTDIENMIPWERDVYVGMVKDWVKQENKRIEEQNSKMKQQTRR
jgi:hypothetical protein